MTAYKETGLRKVMRRDPETGRFQPADGGATSSDPKKRSGRPATARSAAEQFRRAASSRDIRAFYLELRRLALDKKNRREQLSALREMLDRLLGKPSDAASEQMAELQALISGLRDELSSRENSNRLVS